MLSSRFNLGACHNRRKEYSASSREGNFGVLAPQDAQTLSLVSQFESNRCMIANIKKNRSPHRVFKYLLDSSKQARVLGGQVFGDRVNKSIGQPILDPVTSATTVRELSELFQTHSHLNGYATGSVRHISLGFDPIDGFLSDERKITVASRLMEDLGYGNALWVAVDHHRDDPKHSRVHDHDHIHIVCHSLDFNGSYINDYFDYPAAEQSLRASEKDLGLKEFENAGLSLQSSFVVVLEELEEVEIEPLLVVPDIYIELEELTFSEDDLVAELA